VIEELDTMGNLPDGSRRGAKSQQQVSRVKRDSSTESAEQVFPFSSTKLDSSQELNLGLDSSSVRDSIQGGMGHNTSQYSSLEDKQSASVRARMKLFRFQQQMRHNKNLAKPKTVPTGSIELAEFSDVFKVKAVTNNNAQ